MKTYVDERYKLTVHYNRSYGELYDLEADPGEIRNLWGEPNSLNLKATLLEKYVRTQIGQ